MKLLAVGLVLAAAVAVAPTASALSTRPTPAAIAHWKQIVLKPASLSPWWRGLLGGAGTKLSDCKFVTSKGVTFYDCRAKILGGTVVAFPALVRTAKCSYPYMLVQVRPSGDHHELDRTMKFCG